MSSPPPVSKAPLVRPSAVAASAFLALFWATLPAATGAQLHDEGALGLHTGMISAFDLESDQDFGRALAVGDFNRDGLEDLAIGVSGETVNGVAEAGAVAVAYGVSDDGFGVIQRLSQDLSGVDDVAEQGDRFGAALAVGDFDADGHDDLVVGVPGESFSGAGGAGGFHVFYGGGFGATGLREEFFDRSIAGGVPGSAAAPKEGGCDGPPGPRMR